MSDEVTVEVPEPDCTICNDERIIWIDGRAVACRCSQ